MSKPKIGFVGVGGMGQCAHLRNYASLDICEVVAISELRPELGRRVAEKYGVPNIYPDAQTMLANEQLDGIVASQPFDRHGQIFAPLYQNGIPVFTEKPLAGNIAVGERLMHALSEGGSWHMVGYHKRSDPATIAAKAEIDRLKQTGELGALKYVRISMPPGDWIAGGFYDMVHSGEQVPPMPPDPEPIDMDTETYGQYLSFVNYYIHQVNLLRHLFGANYEFTYADPSGVLVAAQSVEGIPGVIEMAAYQTSIDWHETALVTFERGYVRLALPAPVALNRSGQVEFFRDPGNGTRPETIIPALPWDHAMRQQARNFVLAIEGKIAPPCDAAEALEDLKAARQYIRLWKGK